MKKLTNWTILFCITLFFVSCSGLGTYNYEPHDGIKINIVLKKIKKQPEHKSIFVYFDLLIENGAQKKFFLNPGKLKAKLNGVESENTYYDSLASVMPKKEELKKGANTYQLYFVFPDSLKELDVNKFEIINFGLSSPN